ncbi:ATP phosphoribosyltransferase [Limihaloglobus sulfuriphilus]|uniref:ATP phosphoribosyltransferase n=1 Tax=Limihaloglobus sulfuriphilus TaxID=1851148 RepID=A0A1Q2MDD1_9BACT|nr:ATP phosphoribosyltransferase [Limihaloglobus sulfuriphilus]AQQ70272.1 ATP phosphoribosyltransferase [Limihaloglobus sulfuriphilus]
MLKIAVPNKGSLSEVSIKLIKEAGYKCRRDGRELTLTDVDNNVEFYFLRPRDIAIYVAKGIMDVGITGKDLVADSEAAVVELLSLGIGKSRFFYAVPKESELTPDEFDGVRIATSYPNIVKSDMQRRGLTSEIIKLDGAVEISVKLGVADVIADVVESGKTLVAAGLRTVGEPIMKSEAAVFCRNRELLNRREVGLFIERLRGIIVAREYKMIEYDVLEESLERACGLTPGIESPTVSPLSKKGWIAVKAMISRKQVNSVMDDLTELGAKGIIVTDIHTCRL